MSVHTTHSFHSPLNATAPPVGSNPLSTLREGLTLSSTDLRQRGNSGYEAVD